MGEACSTHGIDEKCVQHFGRKPEGKRPLKRTRRKWEDNIRMYLKVIKWKVLDWIHFVQHRDQWRALRGSISFSRVTFLWS
jgi:hypothetical protein